MVRSIYQHEGIGAIYRGFLLAQMVWGPYNAVYLPLWEATKRACVWYSGAESVEKLKIHYELGSSFLSSAFAAGLTNPMVSLSPSLFLSSSFSSQHQCHLSPTQCRANSIQTELEFCNKEALLSLSHSKSCNCEF